jgi:transposase, IS5 family
MKPKKTNHHQGRLFESRLSQILNPEHRLRLLADIVCWDEPEKEFSGNFTDTKGAPGKPVRLVAGLLMLQHMAGVSDEQAIAIWRENPYWQYFCGYDYFQWDFPINPSSLSRWRKRLGEKGMSKIMEVVLKAGLEVGAVKRKSLESVIVDTTVMPKNIAYPTDAKLYFKSINILVKEAKEMGIILRQTYTFLSKEALRKACSYSHARQMKRAGREVKRLHTYLGRVQRDIARKLNPKQKELLSSTSEIVEKILAQKRTDKKKIYSVHEPKVECISKGKAHKKYEFGCKASVVVTHKEGFALYVGACHGQPYDGHTLKESLKKSEEITNTKIKRSFVDKGYRGHGVEDTEIYITGKRGLTLHFKKLLRRRQAIEPQIGHMKSDGKLGRNFLKGVLGDKLNAILCGVGHNIRFILNYLEHKPA